MTSYVINNNTILLASLWSIILFVSENKYIIYNIEQIYYIIFFEEEAALSS